MGYAYIAFHPKQRFLLEHVQQSLESSRTAFWVKPHEVDWDELEPAAFLSSVLTASTVLIFLDADDELDPPDYLDEIVKAKRQQKPFFVIKSQREFDLLLPQIRALLPRHSITAPQPLLTLEASMSSLPPFRVRPGWFELGLLLLISAMVLVILAYLMR